MFLDRASMFCFRVGDPLKLFKVRRVGTLFYGCIGRKEKFHLCSTKPPDGRHTHIRVLDCVRHLRTTLTHTMCWEIIQTYDTILAYDPILATRLCPHIWYSAISKYRSASRG